MDDRLHFEPNLFDVSQTEVDVSASGGRGPVSSSLRERQQVVPGSRQEPLPPQELRLRLSENAKIFALLQASSNNSLQGGGSKFGPTMPSTFNNIIDKDKTGHKVTFDETPISAHVHSTGIKSSNGFDPFMPNDPFLQQTNPHLNSMLSSLTSHTSPLASKKRTLRLDTTSSSCSDIDKNTCDGNDNHSDQHDTTPLRNGSDSCDVQQHNKPGVYGPHEMSVSKATTAYCSTPLSRFIELYEHDDEGDEDDGGHEDNTDSRDSERDRDMGIYRGRGTGRQQRQRPEDSVMGPQTNLSPNMASLLQQLQKHSPPSRGNRGVGADSMDRQYFTFDAAHISPKHGGRGQGKGDKGELGSNGSQNTTGSGVPPPSSTSSGSGSETMVAVDMPSDLDSFLACFPLTPLASTPAVRSRPQIHTQPSFEQRKSTNRENAVTSQNVDASAENSSRASSPQARVSVLHTFDDVVECDGDEGKNEENEELTQHLPAVLPAAAAETTKDGSPVLRSLLPEKSTSKTTTIAKLSSTVSAESNTPVVVTGAATMPTLPPCPLSVASASSFAPPAALETLLLRHTVPPPPALSVPSSTFAGQHQLQQSSQAKSIQEPNPQGQVVNLPWEAESCHQAMEFSSPSQMGGEQLQRLLLRRESIAPSDEAEDSDESNQEPSIEAMSRYISEKFCPHNPDLSQPRPRQASIQISTVAAATGCSHRKIHRVFRLLDSFSLVRQTVIKPATFLWLPQSRLDMMGRLEILFAELQADVLGATDAQSRRQEPPPGTSEFLEGVKQLYLSLDQEAQSGNVHCLLKNRSKNYALDWMERTVVTRILLKKFLAEALIGINSHCHPTRDVPQAYLEQISSQTRIHVMILRKRLQDIASVLCGLEVLQRIPILSFLPNRGAERPSSVAVTDDLKTTFRWVFPLDYLSIYYRHHQVMAKREEQRPVRIKHRVSRMTGSGSENSGGVTTATADVEGDERDDHPMTSLLKKRSFSKVTSTSKSVQ